MKVSRRRTDKPKEVEEKNFWTPYYATFGGQTYDAFGGQREPNKADLVKAYDDIVYACVSMIASNLAHIPIKLYVRTATGQRAPKCATKAASREIRRKYYGVDVQEVLDHPLVELLAKCNAYHNQHDLLNLTQIYLDLTGNSYWLMHFNDLGIPEKLYLLPSHLVQPERDENYFVKEWIFGQGTMQKHYSLHEVIHFKYANPLDCYGEGVSPLRGAWGRREISAKENSYLDNYLSNMGKPDAILAVKDSVNPTEAERVAKEFRHRYQGQGNGGLLVLDGTMNLTPLNFPAKDLAEMQVYQVIKTVICNCYHIPPDIFEMGTSSNRATREAALYSLAKQCLQPRIEGIVQKLNDQLVPFFDRRFFFEAENVVPQDKEYELQVEQMLLGQQVVTRDEIRVRHGYDSQEWAQQPLLPSGVLPAVTYTNDPEKGDIASPGPESPKDRTLQARSVIDLQRGVQAGEISREAALGMLQVVYGFSPEEAAVIIPPPTKKPQPEAEQSDSQSILPGVQAEPAPQASPEQSDATGALRATVGGSQAVADLQRSYYKQELPREAAIANAVLIFGFTEEEASRLFPELPPNAPKAEEPGLPPESPPVPEGPIPFPKSQRPAEAKCACQDGKCGGEGSGVPGPCPEPGQQTGGGGHADRQAKITAAFHAQIDKQAHLSDAQKSDYKQATSKVVGNMSPKALDRLASNVKSVRYYGNTANLTDSLMQEDAKLREQLAGKNMVIKGAYDKRTGTLDLDGPDTLNGKPATTENFYAHEMSHALDGKYTISGTKEWADAWQSEIQGGKLSKMGTLSQHEGFAEFGRAMLVGKPDLVKQYFPKSYAVWKANME